jgi:aspartyl-tRNA(Asn)/glutamyl-tRNA(Gln) amidotransferase subunit B
LPGAKKERYQREFALSAYDADLLIESRKKAEFFELANKIFNKPKTVANWVNGELTALLKKLDVDFVQLPVLPEAFAGLIARIADQTISTTSAKDVLEWMMKGEGTADEIIEKRGLRQISDASAIEKMVDEVLAANARLVADYRAGKEKAFNALVGQVMKASRGKANPQQASEILRRKLG